MKVAIVGRRNMGKSTLVNTLAQAERMIVSEVPGTTRDSVDVRFELDGKAFVAIDTPGFRRAKSFATDIDFYSTHRAQRSIRRADVVLLFFDATQRISKVDKQLCDYIAQQYKPCIFVVNKWDLTRGMPTEKWVTYLRDNFRTMWYVPIAFITGQTGKNVKAMLNHAQMLFSQSLHACRTRPVEQAGAGGDGEEPAALVPQSPPEGLLRHPSGVQPPTIVLFCNDPKALSLQYQRYLLRVFRDKLEFGEVPIKLYLRQRASATNATGSTPGLRALKRGESSVTSRVTGKRSPGSAPLARPAPVPPGETCSGPRLPGRREFAPRRAHRRVDSLINIPASVVVLGKLLQHAVRVPFPQREPGPAGPFVPPGAQSSLALRRTTPRSRGPRKPP